MYDSDGLKGLQKYSTLQKISILFFAKAYGIHLRSLPTPLAYGFLQPWALPISPQATSLGANVQAHVRYTSRERAHWSLVRMAFAPHIERAARFALLHPQEPPEAMQTTAIDTGAVMAWKGWR